LLSGFSISCLDERTHHVAILPLPYDPSLVGGIASSGHSGSISCRERQSTFSVYSRARRLIMIIIIFRCTRA